MPKTTFKYTEYSSKLWNDVLVKNIAEIQSRDCLAPNPCKRVKQDETKISLQVAYILHWTLPQHLGLKVATHSLK